MENRIMKYLINSPLRVPVSSKKDFILNLNNYRNTHCQTLNKAKKNYKAVVAEQVLRLPVFDKITVKFKLFSKTKRLTDIPNVLAIHDKFFADSLVEFGRLSDDNYLYWLSSLYEFGEVDKDNPRVEITITTE